jgi:hypothetical protein
MRCAKCGSDNREGRKFCSKCGAALARLCPQCGASNEQGEDFCGDCGTALAGHTSSATTSSPQAASAALNIRIIPEQQDPSTTINGERKTVTARVEVARHFGRIFDVREQHHELQRWIDNQARLLNGWPTWRASTTASREWASARSGRPSAQRLQAAKPSAAGP